MSLQPIERIRNVSEIKTGTHLLCISDMNLLKYPDGKIQKVSGFPAIIVTYKDGKNKRHDQCYVMDNDFRQKSFERMMQAAQVPMASGTPKKVDAIGKRLWAAIREVHYVEDDVIVQEDGKDKIEYFIFKVYPFMEGGKKPKILGDPEDNDGLVGQEFLSYKNIAPTEFIDEMTKYQAKPTVWMDIPKKTPEQIENAKVKAAISAKIASIPIPTSGETFKEQDDEVPAFDEEINPFPEYKTKIDQAMEQVIKQAKEEDNEMPIF